MHNGKREQIKLSPRDECEVIKYLLATVYENLRIRSHGCDSCSDCYEIWTELRKLADSYDIHINEFAAKTA